MSPDAADDPDDLRLRVALASASMIPAATQAVSAAAGALGLPGPAEAQFRAIVSDALGVVVSDSFDGSERIDVDLEVHENPGEVCVIIRQRGAPSTYLSGELPARLQALVGLGYADSLDVDSLGVRGSEMRVRRALPRALLVADEAFREETAADAVEDSEVSADDIEIRPITADDVVGVARLYYRTYGYTKIGSPWIYQPEVFVRMLDEGRHAAAVAITPSGRIVGHNGFLRDRGDSVTASGGPMAVEPAFRRLGLSSRMSIVMAGQLAGLGLRGIYGEAVTAHPASQAAALRVGMREVGVILGRQPPELEFIGFEGESGVRRAVMVFYGPIAERVHQVSHVPSRYADIVRRIYDAGSLPRTVSDDLARPPSDLPERSVIDTALTSETRFAKLTVSSYGADFLEALQQLLAQLELARFDVVTVRLPLASPLTAYFGSGLSELGLSFNAVFPDQDGGDELVLARCVTDQDPETIAVASDFGRELLDFVVADRESVTSSLRSRARSRAYMARIIDTI